MPNSYSVPGDPRFIPSDEILRILPYDLKVVPCDTSGAARYFGCPSLRIKVGFISSVSRPFCGDCDRIRLTADGLLYTCLYDRNNIDLFGLLANSADRAPEEFKKLLQSKRFDIRQRAGNTAALPSFCSIGG
jgi:cyclic pyranopterin phosphate synthase